MSTVSLPTPIVVAGGALCALAGFLLGVVAGPDTPARTTGVVESFDREDNTLCLSGETVAEQEGADEDGLLCGIWRRSSGSPAPAEGDEFRFVSVRTAAAPKGEDAASGSRIFIYGDVVE